MTTRSTTTHRRFRSKRQYCSNSIPYLVSENARGPDRYTMVGAPETPTDTGSRLLNERRAAQSHQSQQSASRSHPPARRFDELEPKIPLRHPEPMLSARYWLVLLGV